MTKLTGIDTFLNIPTPLRASMRATSCGVDTMTAPSSQPCRFDGLTIHYHKLTETELYVARSRWHVHYEHVKILAVCGPVDIKQ